MKYQCSLKLKRVKQAVSRNEKRSVSVAQPGSMYSGFERSTLSASVIPL